jgi:hypothetical protein
LTNDGVTLFVADEFFDALEDVEEEEEEEQQQHVGDIANTEFQQMILQLEVPDAQKQELMQRAAALVAALGGLQQHGDVDDGSSSASECWSASDDDSSSSYEGDSVSDEEQPEDGEPSEEADASADEQPPAGAEQGQAAIQYDHPDQIPRFQPRVPWYLQHAADQLHPYTSTTILQAVFMLMSWKISSGVPDGQFNQLLGMLKDCLLPQVRYFAAKPSSIPVTQPLQLIIVAFLTHRAVYCQVATT